MIVRIDKNFKIIEKIEEEEDKPIVATEVGVRKLKIYLEEDNPELVVSITFKRADNFVIGAFNIPIIQNEMGGYYREYLFNNEDITAVAGALEVTIRFEKYFNNELIFSRPVNLVMAIYQAVATGNDTLSYLVEELEQTKRELKTTNDNKVDKVTGKGLSTEDYTTTEKNKLSGIEAGAEVNVQSDWTQEVNTADDYIKNKPAIPTKTSDLTNDTGYITGYTETDPIFTAWDKSTGISITKSQITDLIEATQTISGLMSATDKQRLDVLHALLEEDTENSVVDSINEVLAIFNNYPEGADLVTALAGKVDKVTGKGLSTEDYTTTEKNKLSGIQVGAQVNAVTTVAGRTGAVVLSKADVGLSNVDNTSDGTKYVQGLRETRANVSTKIWTGTQAQYDAIVTKDATTLYFITE